MVNKDVAVINCYALVINMYNVIWLNMHFVNEDVAEVNLVSVCNLDCSFTYSEDFICLFSFYYTIFI